jgi:hypothetical protein
MGQCRLDFELVGRFLMISFCVRGNAMHVRYKDQSVSDVYGNNRSWLWRSCQPYDSTLCKLHRGIVILYTVPVWKMCLSQGPCRWTMTQFISSGHRTWGAPKCRSSRNGGNFDVSINLHCISFGSVKQTGQCALWDRQVGRLKLVLLNWKGWKKKNLIRSKEFANVWTCLTLWDISWEMVSHTFKPTTPKNYTLQGSRIHYLWIIPVFPSNSVSQFQTITNYPFKKTRYQIRKHAGKGERVTTGLLPGPSRERQRVGE